MLAILAAAQYAIPPASADVINPEVRFIVDPTGEHHKVMINEGLDDNGGPPTSSDELAWGTLRLHFEDDTSNPTDPLISQIGKWWVWKSVTNLTEKPWFDFHMAITVMGNPSDQNDGISFGEMFDPPVEPYVEGPHDDWQGMIMNRPFDEIWYKGESPVLPGETIHFVFPLSGTTFVPWFELQQHATPEPGSVALALMGGLGLACLARRRNQR